MKIGQSTRAGRALTGIGVVLIALATLTPRPDQREMAARTPPWCLLCGELGGVDVLLNLLLFMPLGAGLRLFGFRHPQIAFLSLGASLLVELLQLAIPGRDPALSDLLTNSLGGAAGGALAGWVPHLLRPARPLAGILALGSGCIWLIQTGLTATLVTPTLPHAWYWGQLAPDLPQFEQFTGRVAAASAGPHRIRIRRLQASTQVRQALLGGEPLVAMTTPGAPTPGLAPIVSIFDQHQREIVLVGRWDNDLVYRLRTRAFDARLRPPTIRLPHAFSGLDASVIGVSGRFDPSSGAFEAALRAADETLERVVPLDAQWGWSLLLPFPYAHGAESRWLTALWVTAWMVPLGYWSAAYRPLALAGAGVILTLGLGIVPPMLGLGAAGALVWLAGAAGLACGAAAWFQPPRARSAASP